MIGVGTAVDALAIITGAGLGMLMGNRLSARTRDLVTGVLGIFVLVLAIQSIAALSSTALKDQVGSAATVIVLVALIIGAVIGSWLRIEQALENFGIRLQKSLNAKGDQTRFVEGFVTASLVFCVGPLAILGSVNDGLGLGSEQLIIKSTLDFFTAMAFASFLGIGVMASAIPVVIIQGGFTLIGFWLGDVLSTAQIDALTAAGGVILIGLSLRLLGIKSIAVGDLLPGLVTVPLAIAILAQLL